MSINKIFTPKDKIDVHRYDFILNVFQSALSGNFSLEETVFIEGQVFDFIDSIADLDFQELTEFNLINSRDIITTENIIKYAVGVHQIQTSFLHQAFVGNFNEGKLLLESIVGKIKRIKQKKAALDIWNNEFIKFVLSEKFINYDSLAYNLVSGPQCTVNTAQGVLTLPVKAEKVVSIKGVSISSGNGASGNSDLEVDISTSKLGNLIDKNLNSWFEYERLDNGPVQLTLNFELQSEEIVNYIEIVPQISDSYFNIKDIKYSGNSRDYKSIKDLTLVENDKYYTPKELDGEQKWNLSFLPVKVKNIFLVLECNYAEYIKVQGVNSIANRLRYSIGIKEVSFKKIKYEKMGSINSSDIALTQNCYVGDSEIRIIPNNSALYDLDLDVSTNSGKTWQEDILTKSFLVDDEKRLLYKLNIDRQNQAFLTSSTFEREEDNSWLKTKGKMASKLINPNTITINESVTDDEIFVYQDTLILRSNDTKDLRLLSKIRRLNAKLFNSQAPTGDYMFLPFNYDLSDYDIYNEDIEIYVNNIKWDEVNSLSDLSSVSNSYFITENLKSIVFHRDCIEYGSRIKWKVRPQELFFFRREKGYYSKFTNLFNPSKGSIVLDYISPKESTHTERINRAQRMYKLKSTGVLKESLTFHTDTSLTFNLVLDKESISVVGQTVNYYFNEEKSILYFPQALNFQGFITLRYTAKVAGRVNPSDYEIWFEDGEPKGVRIENEKLMVADIEETLDADASYLVNKYSLIEKAGYARTSLFSGNDKIYTLSHKNIVGGTVRLDPTIFKNHDATSPISPIEVLFKDGFTEFLDLKSMDNETTNSIYADVGGIVKFKLGAGAGYYPEAGIEFSDTSDTGFKTPKSQAVLCTDPGDYYINGNTGDVVIFVGVTESLKDGIVIKYFYLDPTQDKTYKFSIDYPKGILYLSENAHSGYGKIYYKTCDYVASYRVVDQIKFFSYRKDSKRVEVDSAYLNEKSKMLNVAYLVKDVKVTLEELREYFTPFIDRINFRFK